jgi:hypothetical protein
MILANRASPVQATTQAGELLDATLLSALLPFCCASFCKLAFWKLHRETRNAIKESRRFSEENRRHSLIAFFDHNRRLGMNLE